MEFKRFIETRVFKLLFLHIVGMSHSDSSLNNIDQRDHYRHYPNEIYPEHMTILSVDIRQFDSDLEQRCQRSLERLQSRNMISNIQLNPPLSLKRKRTNNPTYEIVEVEEDEVVAAASEAVDEAPDEAQDEAPGEAQDEAPDKTPGEASHEAAESVPRSEVYDLPICNADYLRRRGYGSLINY